LEIDQAELEGRLLKRVHSVSAIVQTELKRSLLNYLHAIRVSCRDDDLDEDTDVCELVEEQREERKLREKRGQAILTYLKTHFVNGDQWVKRVENAVLRTTS